MADTTQAAGALPEPIHERCKFAAGGARCAKHCGDTVCLPPEIVDTVVLARLNASIAWLMEGKSPGPLGCIGVGDMKRLVAMMAERDAAREQRDAIHLCYEHLQRCHDDPPADLQERVLKSAGLWDIAMERDALRRELEELRAIPPDAREGREPLTEEQMEAVIESAQSSLIRACSGVQGQVITIWHGIEPHVIRATERMHRIGPAGTSADGETQP